MTVGNCLSHMLATVGRLLLEMWLCYPRVTRGWNTDMSTPIEDRVKALEQKVADQTRLVVVGPKDPYAWRCTVGISANDPSFDEMVRLGAEYRKAQRWEDELHVNG